MAVAPLTLVREPKAGKAVLELKLYHDIFDRTLPPLEQLEFQAERRPDAEIFHMLGLAFFQKLQFSQAVTQFSRAIELDSKAWEPRLHRGLALVIMGQFEPALADFSAVLDSQPEQFEALYNRGRVYSRLRDDARAIADLEAAVRLDPREARRLRVPEVLRVLRRRQSGQRATVLDHLLNWIDRLRSSMF